MSGIMLIDGTAQTTLWITVPACKVHGQVWFVDLGHELRHQYVVVIPGQVSGASIKQCCDLDWFDMVNSF